MKIMISLASLLILFSGIMQFMAQFSEAAKKTALIILVVLLIIMTIANRLLMGLERVILFLMAIAIGFVAYSRFFPLSFFPPTTLAAGLSLVALGALGFIYGVKGGA